MRNEYPWRDAVIIECYCVNFFKEILMERY